VHGLSKERVRCIAEQAGIKRRLRPSKTRCAVPGCDQLAHARGICNRHYQIEYQAPRRAAAAARRAERRVSPERLGSFLRQLREALKVHSTTKMARTCGFSPNYLRLIRTRFYVPSVAKLSNIKVRGGTIPIRIVIDATSSSKDRQEKSEWAQALEYAISQKARGTGLKKFFKRHGGPSDEVLEQTANVG
jgi:hypothetical protein